MKEFVFVGVSWASILLEYTCLGHHSSHHHLKEKTCLRTFLFQNIATLFTSKVVKLSCLKNKNMTWSYYDISYVICRIISYSIIYYISYHILSYMYHISIRGTEILTKGITKIGNTIRKEFKSNLRKAFTNSSSVTFKIWF